MKDYLESKKRASIYLLSFIFITIGTVSAQSDHVSFDSLFPKTWYTKATESCSQVWGALEDLACCSSKISQTEKSIIVDAAIGRLVFAQFCLDLLLDAKEQIVSGDDMMYLARVVAVVEERYMKVVDSLETDRAYCLRRVIDELKKKIQGSL